MLICSLINVCLALLTTIITSDFSYRKNREFLNWLYKRKDD